MPPSKQVSIRDAVLEYLEHHRPEAVDLRTLRDIQGHAARRTGRDKAPSREYVLDILLSTDIAVDRRAGGIPSDLRRKLSTASLAEARKSLSEMTGEYERAADRARAQDVRRAVQRTREHIRLALRGRISDEKRAVKQEIFEWLGVWLENPAIFESWLAVREGPAGPDEKPNGSD